MKVVRFEKLVEAAGRPETHLIFSSPETDKTLQAAVRASRVVTVHQPSVGAKADYGAVGFDPGPSRQFLIFPRGVGRFKARRIVGINYGLLGGDAPPRRKAKREKIAPKKKKLSKPEKVPRLKVPALPVKSASEPDLAAKVRKALQLLRGEKRAEAVALLRKALEAEE